MSVQKKDVVRGRIQSNAPVKKAAQVGSTLPTETEPKTAGPGRTWLNLSKKELDEYARARASEGSSFTRLARWVRSFQKK